MHADLLVTSHALFLFPVFFRIQKLDEFKLKTVKDYIQRDSKSCYQQLPPAGCSWCHQHTILSSLSS